MISSIIYFGPHLLVFLWICWHLHSLAFDYFHKLYLGCEENKGNDVSVVMHIKSNTSLKLSHDCEYPNFTSNVIIQNMPFTPEVMQVHCSHCNTHLATLDIDSLEPGFIMTLERSL